MIGVRRFFIAMALLLTTLPMAIAEDHPALLGDWTIRTLDPDASSFSGRAKIVFDAENNVYRAEMITEDTCCNGDNYAKVQQAARIDFNDDVINIRGEIEAFLILEEKRPEISYSPDNFELVQIDALTMRGRLNGYVDVEWTKRRQAIS